MSQGAIAGRDGDVQKIRSLVERGNRCVSVVGIPGIGKTAALRVAIHPLATSWCDLTSASCRLAALSAIAVRLGLSVASYDEDADRMQMGVGAALCHDGATILVLDSVEPHLEMGPAVAHWLEVAPELTVLVAACRAVGVRGEVVYELPPLPADQATVVLLESARRAGVTWLSATEEGLIPLVDYLGGIPLALHLAGYLLRTRTPVELLAEVQRDPLLLTDLRVGVPVRQRSLLAALGTVWSSLDGARQEALLRLAWFKGDIGRSCALAVLEPLSLHPDRVLDELVRCTLVRVEAAPDTGLRFGVQPVVRSVLAVLSGDDDPWGTRLHAVAEPLLLECGAIADRVETRDGVKWLRRLELESDNLDAVVRCSDPVLVAGALCARWPLVNHAKYPGRLRSCNFALEGALPDDLRARVLCLRAHERWRQQDLEGAWQDFESARLSAIETTTVEFIGYKTAAFAIWHKSAAIGEEKLAALEGSAEGGPACRARRLLLRAWLLLSSDPDEAGILGVQAAELARLDGFPHVRLDALCLALQGSPAGNRDWDGLAEVEALALDWRDEQSCQNLAFLRACWSAEACRFDDSDAAWRRGRHRARRNGDLTWEIHTGAILALPRYARDPDFDPRVALVAGISMQRSRMAKVSMVCALAAAEGELGETRTGRRHLERLHGIEEPSFLRQIAIARCLLDLCEPGGANAATLERARLTCAEATGDPLGAVRALGMVLERVIERCSVPDSVLRVQEDGRRVFLVDGKILDLGRRRSSQLVLCALVSAYTSGRTVTVEEVFDAGWPGETIRVESAVHRVHALVSLLRRQGLRENLESVPGGYRLVGPLVIAPADGN